jgi:hypothetical protein
MTGVGWYSQQISLNFLNLVKFYICKPKSTGRGSLIKKQTISREVYKRVAYYTFSTTKLTNGTHKRNKQLFY